MKSQLSCTLFAMATLVTSTALPAKAGMWEGMAENPKKYCSDIVKKETVKEVEQSSEQNLNKESKRRTYERLDKEALSQQQLEQHTQAERKVRQKSTQGSLKIGPIGGGGGHSKKTVDASREQERSMEKSKKTHNKSERGSNTSSTVDKETRRDKSVRKISNPEKIGKNCDALVQSAGQVESTEIKAKTNRQAIESKKEVKMEKIETKAQQQRYKQLMNW